MKKYIISILLASTFMGCTKYLDVVPDKSGSAVIYHMDQLNGMMGNAFMYNNNTYLWTEAIFASDDVEISPYWYSKGGNSAISYGISVWEKSYYEQGIDPCSWSSTYASMFTFNTVLENLDKVTQTTPQIRDQVKGEALFARAYFHFCGLVMYSQYDLKAPGIGYKDNSYPPPSGVPSRETVEYTINRIDADLNEAEKALKAAGKTTFEIKRNFRITVPTLNAFRARFELYRGNYEKALEAANAALTAYNVLLDVKTDPLYDIKNPSNVNTLDADGKVTGKLPYYELTQVLAKGREMIDLYPEFYLPHTADLYFSARAVPMSESLYNLFDKDNDDRFTRFYKNNYCVAKVTGLVTGGLKYDVQQNLKPWEYHTYHRFVSNSGSSGKKFLLGPTTAEMYLIKAECLARKGQAAEAKAALVTLRNTRFSSSTAASNISGTVQDVIDERRREFAGTLRWYDLKRLNGKENANITIKKKRHSVITDLTSPIIEVQLKPNDPFYAIPIPFSQIVLMGWEQNK